MTRALRSLPLLAVRDLVVRFDTDHGTVRAVNGVSFDVEEGETVGLVGESGSGKSVTSLAILGLVPPPGAVAGGRVFLEDENLLLADERRLRTLRGGRMAMVFQDPLTSLNPLLTVGRQLTEVVEEKRGLARRAARSAAAGALGEVGIPAPEGLLDAWPHQLSGGMRQRVMIAMALLGEPRLLVADEPTTALDVTTQAQVLDVLRALQERHGTGVLLITHDLGVVAGMATRLCVMYAGSLVETGPVEGVFARPAHPYTRGLLEAVPRLDGAAGGRLRTIEGQPPDLTELPEGCAFAPRCQYRGASCEARQVLEDVEGEEGRQAACVERNRVVSGG